MSETVPDKKKTRDYFRAGRAVGQPPRFSNCEADDFGNEQSDAGTVSERSCETKNKEYSRNAGILFIGYSAASYFHSSEIKINSWTTDTKKMRGSMPRKCVYMR